MKKSNRRKFLAAGAVAAAPVAAQALDQIEERLESCGSSMKKARWSKSTSLLISD